MTPTHRHEGGGDRRMRMSEDAVTFVAGLLLGLLFVGGLLLS